MVTAQDKFSEMLREEVAPALRRLGAKGSGSNFVLPDPDYFLLLAFQKDRYSTADTVSFTVNLAAVNRREWEEGWQPWWGKEPTATTFAPVGRHTRLGLLMPQQRDIWWEVTVQADTKSLAAEVVAAIRDYGLPGLHSAKVRAGEEPTTGDPTRPQCGSRRRPERPFWATPRRRPSPPAVAKQQAPLGFQDHGIRSLSLLRRHRAVPSGFAQGSRCAAYRLHPRVSPLNGPSGLVHQRQATSFR